MVTRILVIFCCLASLLLAKTALAQESFPAADFSELKFIGTVQVSQIIDPQTLILENGDIIRLTGLDFPDYAPDEPGEIALTATKVLRDMLEGQAVNFYQVKNKDIGLINRMGHALGHIERKSDNAWAQGTLLSLGLARVRTTDRNAEMATQMYSLEEKAREEKSGLWENPELKILTPEETMEHIGSFQIVEGRVHGTALNQNRVYLNFGPDWRTDFTVSIAPGDRRRFSQAGIDPLQWNGQTIRVRGWLESYNGPYIEITHPQAIEIPGSAETLQDGPPAPMVKSITTKH